MKEPTRLLAGKTSDLERELLGSWDAEQPSEEARARALTLASLGAGAGAGALLAKAGGSLAPKGAATASALVKWLVVGAAGVVATGGALTYVARAHRDTARGALVAPSEIRATAASASAPSLSMPTPTQTAQSADLTMPQEPAREAPSPRHAPSATTSDRKNDALGEQVSALDRARHTLAGGDAARALRQLGEFGTRFPRGALAEEAEALRIESLLAVNDRDSATDAAARFLAAHPGSPLAPRVRALLGRASGP